MLAFLGGRILPRSQATNVLTIVGFTALGVLGTLGPIALLRDLLLAGLRPFLRRRPTENDDEGAVSRRALLQRLTGQAAWGAAGLTLVGGGVQAARGPEVVRVNVALPELPEALVGYRIAQLSDLHVGPVLDRAWLAEVVATTMALEPDGIAVTGDLVDGRVDQIGPLLEPLRDLTAPDGTWFVTGNHEYYWDAPAWIEAVRGLGLTVLANEHVVVERDGHRMVIAGVHDHRAESVLPGHRSDPGAALKGAPEAAVRILLAHQPRSLHAARDLPYDLQLSGHTHGGQFFPWNLILHLLQPAVRGLNRFGALQVYVNKGTGWWGPPLRSPARSEITLLTLVRA
ncbi:MAG: metallophosphoesterase [Planctomycetota bacterium]|nr:metallophosphoesterase [Planctomycetota bacterium]